MSIITFTSYLKAEGSVEEDPNGVWPFFTLLDAIATGKTVAITNPGFTLQVATSTNEPTALPSLTNTSSGSANNAPVNEINGINLKVVALDFYVTSIVYS